MKECPTNSGTGIYLFGSSFQWSRSFISGKTKHGGKEKLDHHDKPVRHNYANLTPTTVVLTATKDIMSSSAMKSDRVAHLQTFPSTRGASATVCETPIPIIFKKDFKKMPQWDFEDVYNQDANPRQTVSVLTDVK